MNNNQPPRITTTAGDQPGIVSIRVRKELDKEAEALDPYAMGWDAGSNLDNPPPCPFTDGISAKLWRSGFSSRVDNYIANQKRWGGLNASLIIPASR